MHQSKEIHLYNHLNSLHFWYCKCFTGIVAVTGNVLYLYVVHVSNLTLTLTLGYPYRSENKGWPTMNSINRACLTAALAQNPALISLETLWFIWNTYILFMPVTGPIYDTDCFKRCYFSMMLKVCQQEWYSTMLSYENGLSYCLYE